MEGQVKWFSKEKGFGFIVDNDGVEYFFGVRDIKGVHLPNNGALVVFDSAEGSKGLKAVNVVISTNIENRDDERVVCSGCGKRMIPRVITVRSVPEYSICPFCATVYQEFTIPVSIDIEKIWLIFCIVASIIIAVSILIAI